MTDINSNSVKEGLSNLSSVSTNIKELRRYINEGISSLDSRISSPYGYLKQLLTKIELCEKDIVDLCNDFITDAEQTKEEIESVSFEPSSDFTDSTLLVSSATAGTTFAGTESDVGSGNTSLSSQETNGVTDSPEEGLNTQFVEEGERATNGVSGDNQEAFEHFDDKEDSSETGDSSVRGDGEIGSETAGTKEDNILSDEEYEALDALEEPTDSSYIDVDASDAEYITSLVEECDYIPKEDKDYIITQLKKGNIRSAICRILIVQKKQEIAELKKLPAYQNAIYADEAADAYKEAAQLSINSKDQMDLWQLQREKEQEAANLRNTPEYREIEASIAIKEEELHQYESSCKLWEYDYILPLIENGDIDAAKERFNDKAKEAEDSAMMLSKYPASQASAVILFENAQKYKDLNSILSNDEILTYWYLYDNEGEDAANDYLGLLEPKVNSYYGMQMAEESFYNILESDQKGWLLGDLSADWEGIQIGTIEWFEVVKNIFSKTGTMTRSEYAVLYLNNMLGSMSYFIPLSRSDVEGLKTQKQISSQTFDAIVEKMDAGEQVTYLDIMYINGSINEQEYNSFKTLGDDPEVQAFIERNNTDSGFLGMNHLEWLGQFFNSGVTTGNMLPSVLASVMTYGAAGGLGVGAAAANTLSKAAGLATMFIYCLSSDKNAALREGRSEYSSWIHGILSAAGEIGTEVIFDKLFGFIPGLPDFGMMPSSTKWKTIGKIALRLFALAPLGEITEEMVQYALFDPMADIIAYGSTDFNFKFEEALKIALTTYISTFQLQVGSTVISSPATVKKSGTTCEIDIGNGTTIKISYAELSKCYNQETGQIDAQKLNTLLINKTGTTFIINGTEVGLTYEEINSCRDTTGHLVRSKIDSLIQTKLDAIQQQEVTGNEVDDIDIHFEEEGVIQEESSYADVTADYLQTHNYVLPEGSIVTYDSETDTYLLINKDGKVIRDLSVYEKYVSHEWIADVTEMVKGTIEIAEGQYVLYDAKSNTFTLIDSEGKIVKSLDQVTFDQTLDTDVVDDVVSEEAIDIDDEIGKLRDKYKDQGIEFVIANGDTCLITIDENYSFEVPYDQFDSNDISATIDALTSEDFIKLRNKYSDKIDSVSVESGSFHIRTIYGDEIDVNASELTSPNTDLIMRMMTDSDYIMLRLDADSAVKNATYDPMNQKYILTLANDVVLELTSDQVLNGEGLSEIMLSSDDAVVEFRTKNQGKYKTITYSSSTYQYEILVNSYGDTIITMDLADPDIQTKLDMYNDPKYIDFRNKYSGKLGSIRAMEDGTFEVVYISKTRQQYRFSFDASELGTQMLDYSFSLLMSEEYDNFYNQYIFTWKQARSIRVENGKYIITRLNGQELVVEAGNLFSAEVQGQMNLDRAFQVYASKIKNWTQNGNTYTIETIYGDTIVADITQLNDADYIELFESLMSNEYDYFRKNFKKVVQEVSIENGKLSVKTIYGDVFSVSAEVFNSSNFFYEMVVYEYRHMAELLPDGRYRIIDRVGQEFIITEEEYNDDGAIIGLYDQTIEHEALLVDDWLKDNIENMTNNMSAKQREIIDKKVQKIADKIGATKEEVYAALNKALAKVVNESWFANRVSIDTLNAILNSWIKNQHEEGTSSDGLPNRLARRKLEQLVFNVPNTVDPRDAAVYGLLLPNLDTAEDTNYAIKYYFDGPGHWYGRGNGFKTEAVIIYNKAKVVENTTVTAGDSLDYAYYKGSGDDGIATGSSAANPEFTGVGFDEFLDGVNSLEDIENATLEDLAPLHTLNGDTYIEIQVHGRYAHGTDVIQEVIFLKRPDKATTDALDAMNIPWRIINQ